jgi:Type II secretion system (T2SS), protein E, N-terminal domain
MKTSVDVDPILNTVAADAAGAGVLFDAASAPGAGRIPLGRLLVAEGLLSDAQLADALYEGSQTGERVGEVVVRRGLASEEDIARLLADQWGLSYVDRASIWFDADALARLSREDAQRLEALPTRVQDGRVVVAVAEPTEQRLAALGHVIGEDTVVVVVPKSALEAGLHSELLTSSGRPAAAGREEPEGDAPSPASVAVERIGECDADELLPRVVSLPAQATPASEERSEPPAGAQGTVALAQGLVELIEAQLGSVREQQMADTAEKLALLERRIEQLEDELGNSRATLAELGGHLQAIVGLLGRL